MYLLLHECADYSQWEQFQSPAACLPAAGGRGGEGGGSEGRGVDGGREVRGGGGGEKE